MKLYTLRCYEWNLAHVKFNVYDPVGANCGVLITSVDHILSFMHSWRGEIEWNDLVPADFLWEAMEQ